MKKFLILLSILCFGAYADTINLHWLNEDGTTYQNSTCTVDGDLELPTPPTKYGYTFTGWKMAQMQNLEYLESTGTQYIDTGFISNQDTGIKTKFSFNITLEDKSVFGSAINYNDRVFEFGLASRYPTFLYYVGYIQRPVLLNLTDIFVIDWNKNIVNYSINNISQNSVNFNYNYFETPYSMHIFATKRPTGVIPSKAKIYYFQIYDNGTLVRDFIPVLDYTGVPCMYDKVTKQFFYNQGTDQFIAGPVIGE